MNLVSTFASFWTDCVVKAVRKISVILINYTPFEGVFFMFSLEFMFVVEFALKIYFAQKCKNYQFLLSSVLF